MFKINLKREAKENLYTQIYEAVRAEILADKYTPDTKMPSIRALASRLNVNPDTVVKAYDLLAAENLIYKKEGSGSYIAPAAASNRNSNDQRLRILSSKGFSLANKVIDLSGVENNREFLEEYAWDLVFDRFYSEFKADSFSRVKNNETSYFQFLKRENKDISKSKLYYSSKEEFEEIIKAIIGSNKELLFTKNNDCSYLDSTLSLESKSNFKNNKIHISNPDYSSLMKYLENNTIDYLIISDEFLEESVLNWDLSKLKSLLELAQMLNFKLIIIEFYKLYRVNKKIKELLKSRFKNKIILIQKLTVRVFPGLDLGLIYLEKENLKNNSNLNLVIQKFSLEKIINEKIFSAGENLNNNLLSYYLDNNYFKKRIKLLKKRLENNKLLLKEAIRNHFRGVKILGNSSLFYLKLILNTEINQYDFKVFAEKNSILLPNHERFYLDKKSSELIISSAALNQFSIKQGVMALAKIYWQFIS